MALARLTDAQGETRTSAPAFGPAAYTRGKVIPAISQFESRFIPNSTIQRFKTTAQDLIQNLSGNAFNQQQLDQMADEIYKNIPLLKAYALGSINPNQRPLVLSPSQYEIIQEQLNGLTPELRGPAAEHFNRAVQSGAVRCPDCGAPRR